MVICRMLEEAADILGCHRVKRRLIVSTSTSRVRAPALCIDSAQIRCPEWRRLALPRDLLPQAEPQTLTGGARVVAAV